MCVHCGQPLEDGTTDGPEVCRYCGPKFANKRGTNPPRCPACAEGRNHDPADLEAARVRIDINA